MKLTGSEAINYAEANSLTLNKYEDPTEDAREGLTVEEARKVASEDPSLIYVEVEPKRYEVREIPTDEERLGDLLFVSNDSAAAKAFANQWGGSHYYGVAILDTQDRTVDWGDRMTAL